MAWRLDPKTVRRLTAAEGYIELGLPEMALKELEAVDGTGPFEAAKCYLTGEALKAQQKYAEAAGYLQRAATMVPLPQSRPVWVSLSECLRRIGKHELAEMAELNASLLKRAEELAGRAEKTPLFVVNVVIRPKRRTGGPSGKKTASRRERPRRNNGPRGKRRPH